MFRSLILVPIVLAAATTVTEQATSVLHIKVVLTDSDQKQTGVPRHALLVSDNPATAPPKRILTRPDGTVDVTLRPGMYTVESDRPVAFGGKTYQWTEMIEVRPGREASLELTNANAEVGEYTASAGVPDTPTVENDPSFLLGRWHESVVAVWTATSRTSGFVIDTRGLVLTTQRAIGDATAAEVQFSPTLKVFAPVVAVDATRDVAVLRVDPAVVQAVKPITVTCAQPPPPLADDQDLFTIGAPMRTQKNLISGRVMRLLKPVIADFRLGSDSSGGPVFTVAGTLAGMTSMNVDADERMEDVRIVGAGDICEVLKTADAKVTTTAVQSGARLPVEPLRPFPTNALDEAANKRISDSIPYQMSSSDFDISFITPVLVHSAERRWKQAGGSGGAPRAMDAGQERMRLLMEFGHWSNYFDDFPPVLLVRVTPKLVEGFWTKMARGAAVTQGIALPPMKKLGSGFLRLGVLCGNDEVTPIHPFKLAHRINERDVAHEGLYVFDPAVLGPQCGSVKLMLYSEKDSKTPDTRVVDPKLLQLVWDDFAAYRETSPK